MTRAVLDKEEVLWAYSKCCEGVPVAAVAKALYCDPATIRRAFKRYGLRVTNTLKYERGEVMDEATITISVDEYFGLRQKAEMNAMLMKELGETYARLTDLERRLYDLESRVGRGWSE